MSYSIRVSIILRGALIIAISSVAVVAVAGQDRIDFDRLSLEHGLSQSIIEQIIQDQKGFMWFATEDGLNRFDGYRFSVFKNVQGNPNTLSHDELRSIYQDRSGALWFGTFGAGLDRFDPATGEFTNYRHDPADPTSISHDFIRLTYEDSKGVLWVGTQGGGLNRFDRETGTFTHYRHDPEDSSSIGADRRSATFTGLAAGEYLFSVRGANRDGVWNNHGASLRIIVTPPFWATWWFRLLAALLLAALAMIIIQSRMRSVRMKTELVAAHDAQMAIMPQTNPEAPGFDISGVCIPAHEVGGDFFDYFWFEGKPRKLGVVVADVAGKAIVSDLYRCCRGSRFNDDMTIVVIKAAHE